MREQEPSSTALAVASHRAAHQVLEQGRIFPDPLALSILGKETGEVAREAEAESSRREIRFFIAARASFAEATLKVGVEERGVRQLVVLGAGLDTFAYRNPFAQRLRVFEVDHPATQAWKRRRLQEVGIGVPESLVFAPVDFEHGALLDGLAKAHFDPAQRTFFTWLGVVPYLTVGAISSTLSAIGGLPGGAEVVLDYSDPPSSLSPEKFEIHRQRAARVAAVGEPFLNYFDPAALHAMLNEFGFTEIDDLAPRALLTRYLGPKVGASASDRGGHVLFAARKFG